MTISKNIEDIVFDTKNYYCKNAFFLSKLILEETFFDSKGDTGGECFLVDTDRLFEQFIKKILFEFTRDIKFTSWNKDKEYGMSESKEKRYRPDILYGFKEDKAHVIIDVKNKFSGTFKNADVYQMLFYSGILEAKKLILCYPSVGILNNDELEIYSDNFITNRINAVHIDISGDSKNDFYSSIQRFINDIYDCIERND